MKLIKAIGAGLTISVCFLYLGCGSIQIANAANGSNTVPLTIETRLLPSAITGVPYVAVLDAVGGIPDYSWAITSGKLPAGVSLASSTGVISGTPTVTGTFAIGVTLTDAANVLNKPNILDRANILMKKVSTTITLSVAAPSMKMAPTTTLFAANGVPYSQALQVSGGSPAYTWSIASGVLPAGLSLGSTTGIISGTPSTSGIASFTVSVHDSERPARTQSSVVTMDIAPAPLRMAAPATASATVGSAFSEMLQETGGAPGYRWSIASGGLPSGLALNSSTGTISGVPTASGTATFIAMVNDSSNPAQASSAAVTIAVAPSALVIAASTLPTVMVGSGYNQALQVSGGTPPYRWSVTSGQLAAGLTLSSAGTISGIPSVSGSSPFTVTVADSSSPSQSASAIRSVTVRPTPLNVTAPVMPVPTVGTTYSQSFTVSGGTAPYSWRITSGSLPAGLSLTQSGTVSGVLQASGGSTFTATVTDSSSPAQSAAATAGIVVAPSALVINSSSLPGVIVGSAYSQTLQASGGTAPYLWSVTSGRLPGGMSLGISNGTISGTATTSGTSTFTATVTDSSSPAQVTSTTASVVVAPAALSITSATLAQTTVGTAYAQALQAVGGTAPYAWSISSGQLPLGLALSSSGAISGTPVSGTSSSFAVTVTDSGTPTQTQSASLTIAAAPPPVAPTAALSIISPALVAGTTGSAYSQTLQASGGTPGYSWTLTSGSLPAGLTLTGTGVISGSPSTAGTSNFTVQVSDNSTPAKTTLASASIAVAAPVTVQGPGTTWYISASGGGLYSAARAAHGYTGLAIGCNGKGSASYNPAGGPNQNCPLNDLRFLWDDQSGNWDSWIIHGGDTVVLSNDQDWRIGWDQGGNANDMWCSTGNGNNACVNPTIPAGTASQHTRILGTNYASCSTGNTTNKALLTQIFGGYGVWMTLNLAGAQYVDVECLEITSHATCIVHGSPAVPGPCSSSFPISDYDSEGITTDVNTHDLLLQDLFIHGHTDRGVKGPIGGVVTCLRCDIAANGMAGWDFDDGGGTPSVNGVWNFNYSTIEWSGCNQIYPSANIDTCYSQSTGGYGDGVGTGVGTCLTANIDHSHFNYNTQDGLDLGHIDTGTCSATITNSSATGNNGQTFKWGPNENPVIFENNLAMANCLRLSQPMPGTSTYFNAHLSDYCRAGDNVSFNMRQGGTALLANNTIVGYQPTMYDIACWDASCSTSQLKLINNITLGYDNPAMANMGGQQGGTGAIYFQENIGNVTRANNIWYGMRTSAFNCPTGYSGEVCQDPLLSGEPSGRGANFSETELDSFNYSPSVGSPALAAGFYLQNVPLDYTGATRGNPPSIGALEH